MFKHEIHLFGGYLFCGNNQVAFILAVFVIHNDDKFTFLEIFYCIFDAIESIVFHTYIYNNVKSLFLFFCPSFFFDALDNLVVGLLYPVQVF